MLLGIHDLLPTDSNQLNQIRNREDLKQNVDENLKRITASSSVLIYTLLMFMIIATQMIEVNLINWFFLVPNVSCISPPSRWGKGTLTSRTVTHTPHSSSRR